MAKKDQAERVEPDQPNPSDKSSSVPSVLDESTLQAATEPTSRADAPAPVIDESSLAARNVSRFQFVEQAVKAGIEFSYRNGEETQQFALIENLGGGVAILDYDCDGWPDVLLAGGGTISRDQELAGLPFGLFRNQEGRFSRSTDVASFSTTSFYSFGLTVTDFNNDGFDDVAVSGFGGIRLMMNLGDGSFIDATSDSLHAVDGVATSMAASDFNSDGVPDIYVTTYVDWSFANHPYCPAINRDSRELCSPMDFAATRDFLFYGTGDGAFTNMNDAAGIRPDGKGLGVIAMDVDGDQDVDLYVANDTTENFLYINDGRGVFTEQGLLRGAALDERGLANGSMGVSVCDVNQDLAVDLWVANFERESFALYRNDGNANFLHTSRRHGIAALGGRYVGFGTDWEDFDRDGLEEIVVANGHVLKFPTGAPRRQRPLLLSRSGKRYELAEFDQESYFSGRYEGRGLAVGDLDRDGRQDIVISHINENVAYLINKTPPEGDYVRVQLVGTRSTRNASGAQLVLETSGKKRLRTIVGGGSYLSSNQRVAYWGVPRGEQPVSLQVMWPSGAKQTVTSFDKPQDILVVEPETR
ncbi:MAG: CRTAC1 family protein [Pirellulaceae bacterium]